MKNGEAVKNFGPRNDRIIEDSNVVSKERFDRDRVTVCMCVKVNEWQLVCSRCSAAEPDLLGTHKRTHTFRAPSRQSELFPQQWSSTANVPIVKEKVDTTGTIIFAQWLAALSVASDF